MTTQVNFTAPPDLAEIEAMARGELAQLPQTLRHHAEEVILRIDEFPDLETEREMRLESPFDILGLYRGISVGDKSISDIAGDIDMIFLYRRPILDYWCETGEDLRKVIRHVLIHEIGHHFGFSDADMVRIEEEL